MARLVALHQEGGYTSHEQRGEHGVQKSHRDGVREVELCERHDDDSQPFAWPRG